MPGAASAGMDLRLHDIDRTGKPFGDFFSFLRRIGDAALGDRHAEFLQQAFRLILMDVHVGKTLSREWFGANDRPRHRPEPRQGKDAAPRQMAAARRVRYSNRLQYSIW